MASLPAPLSDIALLALAFFVALAVLILGWKAGRSFASMGRAITTLLIAAVIIAGILAVVFLGASSVS